MADRALIIAVEEYNDVTDGFTAKKLDGTIKAAERFRDWLTAKWEAEGVTGEMFFCSSPPQPGHHAATARAITRVLAELERNGRDTTDNLYVYFSGHGFRAAGETVKWADVLVCADFESVQLGASQCFKLDALIEGLRASLGYGFHFYFIDACRNELPTAIASNIMPFGRKGLEEPSVFVLQSTVKGMPALVAGPFANTLLDGLNGSGKAKKWVPPVADSMQVRFDSLRAFLMRRLANEQPITHSNSGPKGEDEAVLAVIKPVPECTLTIKLDTAIPSIRGKATVAAFGGAVANKRAIDATETAIKLRPDYYSVKLEVMSAMATPADAVPVELFEDRTIEFKVQPITRGVAGPKSAGTASPPDNVRISLPAEGRLKMREMSTGIEQTFTESAEVALPEGSYYITLEDRDGRRLRTDQVNVPRTGTAEVAPAAFGGSLPHESIAAFMPVHDGRIDFSKSIGPISDPDLGVWLSIAGAGRILGSQGDYSKLSRLPLADFATTRVDASPIYVLAGLPRAEMTLSVGVGARVDPSWLPTTSPLAGVRESVMQTPPGQHFLTLAIDRQPPQTLATFTMQNRCTLIVLTLDEDEQPRIAQYLLPIGHLTTHLPDQVQERLRNRNQLKDVHWLALLTRAFRKRRAWSQEFKGNELIDLLYAKWLDPIGAAMAAYELARRSQQSLLAFHIHKESVLKEVAGNMQRFFGDLPDTSAIVRLAGEDSVPTGVPLFSDGLRVLPEVREQLPYSAGLLDYTGLWTAWRGAVAPP
jgi:hypothetical protein